ncbi:DUF2312 domain-containing protein [Kiloniella sp. b19]|uniref:DUF2312 domain-containing protein n=1 Tax=Kiloniella sp. GXU_MW_B19 TaxID=3141326 RepID=UPI0031E18D26
MSDFDEDINETSSESFDEAASAPQPTTSSGSSEVGGIAGDRLRGFIDRIERLEEEKKAIADDIKEVYGEAKALGFDTKIIRKIIAMRKMEDHERNEQEELIEVYKQAIGML